MSRGNITTHLRKLERSGLIETERVISNRRPRTLLWLTTEGRERIRGYGECVGSIEERLRSWMEAEGKRSWRAHLHRVYGG